MRATVLLIVCLFANQAATCGQKGPLELPEEAWWQAAEGER